ncbi:hypothetical protein SO694_00001175 [Aureococcus anophagefferens]|uniref:Arrestin-like N-terminal domain-containing protein n=1 Tax=Aureococcus anophagefferens TaxID=44056 RepID=A0ABR1GBB5_AURAN
MGWLDGMSLELTLEGDECLRFVDDPYLKPFNEYGEVGCYKHDGVIRGRVTAKASTKLPVYVNQITIAFEQFSTYNKSIEGHTLAFREWTVADSENLKLDDRGATLPFEIDLSEVYPRDGLRPTYAGTLYYIRHQIFAKAHKPWYSFSGGFVEARAPVHLLRVHSAPARSVAALPGLPPPHILTLDDVAPGATVVFDYGKNCHDLDGAIAGDVVFRGLGDAKVAFAKVELVKVEFAELLSMDTAVWTSVWTTVLHPAKASKGWLKNKVVKSEEEDGDDAVELVEPGGMGGDVFIPPASAGGFSEDRTFSVTCDLAGLDPDGDGRGRSLTPSYRKLALENVPDIATDAAEPRSPSKSAACSPTGGADMDDARTFPDADDDWEFDVGGEGVAETAYFLKLTAITAAGAKCWATKKIYLYKSKANTLQKTIEIDL